MKKAGKESKSKLPEFEALGKVLAALKPLDEKQRAWVIASSTTNLEIAVVPLGSRAGGADAAALAAAAGKAPLPGAPGSDEHAKAFLRQKSPKNDVQRVACLAYYLANHKATPTFKTKDLNKMNNDARGTSIGNMTRAADNATKAKYLAASGKGRKHITGFGESIIEALPNQEEVGNLMAAERPKHRRGRKKKDH